MPPAETAVPAEAVWQPRMLRALKTGLRTAYDYLGTVLLASLAWVGLAMLLAIGGAGLLARFYATPTVGATLLVPLAGIIAAAIGTGPLTAALFHHARAVLANEDPPLGELFRGLARLWPRGLALAALQVIVSLVLAVDAFYFLGQRGSLWRVVGMLFVYPLLFWWAAALVQWPLSVDRPQDSLWTVVKKSFLLLLDNLGYVFLLLALLAAFTLLCAVSRFGLPFAWMGVSVFLQTAAFRELLPKYGLITPAEEAIAEDPA